MTRLHSTGLVLCAASALAAGCASVTERPARLPQADQVAVYETVPPGPRTYRLVKRIWVETWRSAFRVPQYGSAEEGAADLQNQAAALGGDAVMYFGCYRVDPTVPLESRPPLYCNGNVIKYGS